MNDQAIKDLVNAIHKGTVTFPEVVSTLSKEGIESYHVDYLMRQARYYHENGEFLCLTSPHEFKSIAPTFDAERLQAIIKQSQARKLDYQGFLDESAKAGCVYYIVSLTGRKVTYFGRDGGEHVERFPGS